MNLIGSKQVQGRASPGGNLCNASPAADSVPAMFAAGATVTLQGPNGRREMPVEAVPAGPGRTNLAPGEILVSFTLPPRQKGSGDAYLRMIPRTEMDIAVVGCGVSLTLEDGTVTAARVGLGAVAPTVLLVADAAGRILCFAIRGAGSRTFLLAIGRVGVNLSGISSEKNGSHRWPPTSGTFNRDKKWFA